MKTLSLATIFIAAWCSLALAASGDVVIRGVPMVDQGDRAYCVTASLERLLRYHGIPADQTTLAALTRVDPQRGIDLTTLLPTLRPYLKQRGVKIQTLYAWQPDTFVTLLRRYNKAAHRSGLPEIPLRGKTLHVPTLLRQADPAILRQVRLADHRAYHNFLTGITAEINAGRPLLWAVQQGLAPSGRPPATGGHMRLLIGYNASTRELIYTDPWGPGHEASRISCDDTWLMTTGLLKLTPQP